MIMRWDRKAGSAMAQAIALMVGAAALSVPGPAWAGERVLVPQMNGWKQIDHTAGPGVEASSLIPEGETAENWSRRLTVQAFRGSTMSAPAFLDALTERVGEVCDSIAADPVVPGPPGTPYDTARRIVSCGRYMGDGKGLFTYYYALKGRDGLYVLSRSWRGDPFDPRTVRPVPQSEIDRWSATFDAVRLCDTTDSTRPCPAE